VIYQPTVQNEPEEMFEITPGHFVLTTKEQAEKLGIPLKSVDEVDFIDVTVDGADEIFVTPTDEY